MSAAVSAASVLIAGAMVWQVEQPGETNVMIHGLESVGGTRSVDPASPMSVRCIGAQFTKLWARWSVSHNRQNSKVQDAQPDATTERTIIAWTAWMMPRKSTATAIPLMVRSRTCPAPDDPTKRLVERTPALINARLITTPIGWSGRTVTRPTLSASAWSRARPAKCAADALASR